MCHSGYHKFLKSGIFGGAEGLCREHAACVPEQQAVLPVGYGEDAHHAVAAVYEAGFFLCEISAGAVGAGREKPH